MAKHREDMSRKEKMNKKRVTLFWTSLSFIERSYSRTQTNTGHDIEQVFGIWHDLL